MRRLLPKKGAGGDLSLLRQNLKIHFSKKVIFANHEVIYVVGPSDSGVFIGVGAYNEYKKLFS